MSVGEEKPAEAPVVDTRPEWDVSLPANRSRRVRGKNATEAVAAYKKLMGIISSEHSFTVTGPIGGDDEETKLTGAIGDQIIEKTPEAAKEEETKSAESNPLLNPESVAPAQQERKRNR